MQRVSDIVIRIIRQNMNRKMPNWRFQDFEQASYSRWAAQEMIQEVKRRKETPPLIVLEEFRDKMSNYACMNSKASYMFSVACDEATYIIDILLTM